MQLAIELPSAQVGQVCGSIKPVGRAFLLHFNFEQHSKARWSGPNANSWTRQVSWPAVVKSLVSSLFLVFFHIVGRLSFPFYTWHVLPELEGGVILMQADLAAGGARVGSGSGLHSRGVRCSTGARGRWRPGLLCLCLLLSLLSLNWLEAEGILQLVERQEPRQ